MLYTSTVIFEAADFWEAARTCESIQEQFEGENSIVTEPSLLEDTVFAQPETD